jgi:hypothetical protein
LSPDYAEMGYYRYRYGGRKEPRTPPATGWRNPFSTTLAGSRLLILLFLLFLALAGGYWALRAGHVKWPAIRLRLPSVSSVEPRRVLRTALGLAGIPAADRTVCAVIAGLPVERLPALASLAATLERVLCGEPAAAAGPGPGVPAARPDDGTPPSVGEAGAERPA